MKDEIPEEIAYSILSEFIVKLSTKRANLLGKIRMLENDVVIAENKIRHTRNQQKVLSGDELIKRAAEIQHLIRENLY